MTDADHADRADHATHVLVINSGSSSLKFQVVDMATGARPASGLVERIGETGPRAGRIEYVSDREGAHSRERAFKDHGEALEAVSAELAKDGLGLDSPQLAAVGHRVVHGGTRFTEPTLVDDAVLDGLRDLVPLAPLHNPANIAGIETARRLRPDLPQVAVFDTAFHATMPESAWRYAIDKETADRNRVRRYGFHGTSHQYVSRRTAELLGRAPESVNVITLHLGNGASAAAVAGGVCVDTSMGLTPLEGLVMGTRSGDLDPAVLLHLHREAGLGVDELDELLNRRSGMLGLCGENDMREVGHRMGEGDGAAQLAFQVYAHRLKKYIGAYLAVLGRVDAIAFTAGVGENSAAVRAAAVAGLAPLGVELDPVLNAARGHGARIVSTEGSRTAVAVVPTDEEFEIARQSFELVRGQGRGQRSRQVSGGPVEN